MTKKQIAIRASRATIAKIKELQKKYGTQTEVMAVAIDRLCQNEMGNKVTDAESATDAQVADLVAALQVVLDQVDYTAGACKLNEAVSACLPKPVIEVARAALAPFAAEVARE